MHIAIVEDESKLATLLGDYLQKEDYQTSIYDNGTEALQALQREQPDLILLDLMLPGTDGMTICREIRKTSAVPIIMMTARVEEIDRLLGLELGADDYICKTCSLTQIELGLLKTMVAHPGRIYNREQLMHRIYPDNRIVSDRTIDSHIKKLRQKLKTLDSESEYIHSVYGIGYKFETDS